MFDLDDVIWLADGEEEDPAYQSCSERRRTLGQLFRAMALEYQIMDMNEFESKWKLIRGKAKVWWNLINDVDLNKVEKADIKFFEFVTILQLKYELDRQFAKNEIGRRVAEFESKVEPLMNK